MMNMVGRWYTKNKTLVAVHLNKAALPGNREERWLGHSIAKSAKKENTVIFTDVSLLPELKICWNENGECVWVQGIVDDTKNYDLVECVSGRDLVETKMKVEGCLECKGSE